VEYHSERVGTVVAVNGVTVSADLPGLVSEINFTSGQSVSEGQVLVRLDTKQNARSWQPPRHSAISKLALTRTRV
jgi:membrane fusion protein (multidrug efflux system)